MNVPRLSIVAAACSAALMGGCAQMGPRTEAPALKVEPVFRVQQPAGTAAGQYAVGRIDLAEGRVGAAIQRFRDALKLDPTFVEAHNGLGVAFGMQGRYAESAEAFRSALALGPASAHVLNNLGFAQMRAGKLDEARQSFARSLEIEPKNARTRENLRVLVALERDGREEPAASVAAAVPAREGLTRNSPTAIESTPPASAPSATVLSRTDASMLVRLAPNLYELRRVDQAGAQHASVGVNDSATAASAVPAIAVAPVTAAVAPRVTPVAKAEEMRSRSTNRRSPGRIGRFEVSNGAGVERLAARTAVQFARFGVGISRVSNYESFDRVRTEIHYRKGFLKQAQLVQQKLPVEAKLVATDRLRPEINVRLVVGRDMVQTPIAWWGDEKVASAAPTAKVAGDDAVSTRRSEFAAAAVLAALDG